MVTVLVLRGLEILKIGDGLKGQDIYNTQSHNFDRFDWTNYSLTLKSDMIRKPIQ